MSRKESGTPREGALLGDARGAERQLKKKVSQVSKATAKNVGPSLELVELSASE